MRALWKFVADSSKNSEHSSKVESNFLSCANPVEPKVIMMKNYFRNDLFLKLFLYQVFLLLGD